MSLLSLGTEPIIWSTRTFLLIGEIDSLRSILCAVSMRCSLIVVRATQEKFRRGFSPVSLEEGCEEPSEGWHSSSWTRVTFLVGCLSCDADPVFPLPGALPASASTLKATAGLCWIALQSPCSFHLFLRLPSYPQKALNKHDFHLTDLVFIFFGLNNLCFRCQSNAPSSDCGDPVCILPKSIPCIFSLLCVLELRQYFAYVLTQPLCF